jgi:hypothetical protein
MSNKKWRKKVGEVVKAAVDPSIPVQDVNGSHDSKGSDTLRQAQGEPVPEPGREPAPAAARSALSDQQVMDILDLGAKFVHNFLAHATDTLSHLGYQEVRRVAMELEPPEHSAAKPQQRPRGRMHPLLLLVKYGIAATALVQRIFKITHPHLFPAGTEKRERVQDAAEKFMGMVKKAMPEAAPSPA